MMPSVAGKCAALHENHISVSVVRVVYARWHDAQLHHLSLVIAVHDTWPKHIDRLDTHIVMNHIVYRLSTDEFQHEASIFLWSERS